MSNKNKKELPIIPNGTPIRWFDVKFGEVVATDDIQAIVEYEDMSRNSIPLDMIEEYIYKEDGVFEGLDAQIIENITKPKVASGTGENNV